MLLFTHSYVVNVSHLKDNGAFISIPYLKYSFVFPNFVSKIKVFVDVVETVV